MTSPPKFVVRCAPAAATQLQQMKARADASPKSAHATVWKIMRRVLDEGIAIPQYALARGNKLKDHPHVFRMKVGRHRIFYIPSSAHNKAIVLFIGNRKEGDKNDAYRELERRLSIGEFDPQFTELGVTRT